ncbi:hypothetical protein KVR01_003950 [Diaporthe batatas]|uniref:uncharacterized protein n=1 Tax=Diaporthe batatas TaxID=748121 RepID=UPI001D04B97C|nr:uncharacterized protein KVR01_003950 [Diaporthe batatas]KAG8168261.1 hypothetical protein KVR01_003950 [Diaporthe batatas]
MSGPLTSRINFETIEQGKAFAEDPFLSHRLLEGLRAVTTPHEPFILPKPAWFRRCTQQINDKHEADYEVYYINRQLYAVSRLGEFFFYPINIGPGVSRNVQCIRLRHDILQARGRV